MKMPRKYCVVPLCQTTSLTAPNKAFFTLPTDPNRRLKWLLAMRRSPNGLSRNTVGFVCQDHFDLEKDLESYLKFKFRMSGRHPLKKDIVPHIFDCQNKPTHVRSFRKAIVDTPAEEIPDLEEDKPEQESPSWRLQTHNNKEFDTAMALCSLRVAPLVLGSDRPSQTLPAAFLKNMSANSDNRTVIEFRPEFNSINIHCELPLTPVPLVNNPIMIS